MSPRLTLLLTGAAAVLVAAPALAFQPPRYRVAVTTQSAAGDPGVPYVGGPLKVVVHDARGRGAAIRVCLEPAPIDRPSCARGRTGRVVDAGAPSSSGATRLRVELPGGAALDRVLHVLSNAEAQRTAPTRFVRRPVAVYTRRPTGGTGDVSVVVRLNRPLAANGERRPALVVAPRLARGEVFGAEQQFFGGLTPGRIGRRGRHCYLAEAQQPRPLSRPRTGLVWRVGLHRQGRVSEAADVTIRRATHRDLRAALDAAALRMGCGASD